MKLTRNEDIEAPIAFVYGALTDFDHWERTALRRGAEVSRLDTMPVPAPGMGWKISFSFRGRKRAVDLRLTALEPGNCVGFSGTGTSMSGKAQIDLVEMGARRTRMSITLEVEAQSLAARLFLQSLKFATTKVNKRFADRTGALATDIEDRFKRGARR
jgi:carbon monoxide dehydrogenase subunit G